MDVIITMVGTTKPLQPNLLDQTYKIIFAQPNLTHQTCQIKHNIKNLTFNFWFSLNTRKRKRTQSMSQLCPWQCLLCFNNPFSYSATEIFSLSDWMRKWFQERRSNNPEMGDSVDRMARLVANSIPQVWIGRTNLEQGKFWFNYKDIAGAPPKNKDFLGCAHT